MLINSVPDSWRSNYITTVVWIVAVHNVPSYCLWHKDHLNKNSLTENKQISSSSKRKDTGCLSVKDISLLLTSYSTVEVTDGLVVRAGISVT